MTVALSMCMYRMHMHITERSPLAAGSGGGQDNGATVEPLSCPPPDPAAKGLRSAICMDMFRPALPLLLPTVYVVCTQLPGPFLFIRLTDLALSDPLSNNVDSTGFWDVQHLGKLSAAYNLLPPTSEINQPLAGDNTQ